MVLEPPIPAVIPDVHPIAPELPPAMELSETQPATELAPHAPLDYALGLTLELVRALETAEGPSLGAAARHELCLARSLAAHVVDILSGLAPATRNAPATDAE
ncbi:hypothetical protein [Polyangium aurulentum]|uniref:hypothetical protein n=1 Tax=Polyangium aurulentum TaxID=2567896 RepID=UPI0010ADEF0C|nr:hypothetical protein [Polyangium aurulentum]UQA60345.1 hypothetical protein E8A73_007690 [Polyangium aurulentum]